MGKILVVGSLNMDFVAYVRELPAKGETVLADTMEFVPGGKGANQAYAAGWLGADVSMLGAVGNDDNGRKLIANLNKANVNTGAIAQIEDIPTGRAHITVDRWGSNNIVVIPGANSSVFPAMIDEHSHLIDACEIVLLQLEIPVETVCYAAKLAKQKGKTVILDPAPAKADLPHELLACVDIIKPNEKELETLSGMPVNEKGDIVAAAKSLIQWGIKTIVVTAGSHGAYLVTPGHNENFPVEDVKAVDTTAAGDSFIAAFATALADGSDIPSAIESANIVSTIVVTRKGAQSSVPTKEEVRKYREERVY